MTKKTKYNPINDDNLYDYSFYNFFNKTTETCKCKVIGETEKKVIIKLYGFGPKGTPPNTVMSVKPENVKGYKTTKQQELLRQEVENWKKYYGDD